MVEVEERRRPGPHAQLRRTARGWAEPRPTQCSACGASLGPHRTLVGIAQCRCGQSHRTHFCRSCEFTHYSPPLGDECLLLAMDERNLRAAARRERVDEP